MHLKRIEISALALVIVAACAYGIYRYGIGEFSVSDSPWVSDETNVLAGMSTSTTSAAASTSRSTLPAPTVQAIYKRIEDLQTASQGAEKRLDRVRMLRRQAEALMPLDTASAVRLLKTIGGDKTLPAPERALAIETLASTYFDRSNNAPVWAERFIFDTPPYSLMLTATSSRTATWDAFAAVSRFALAINPLPISEYRLALWAARGDRMDMAQEHLAKGDALIVDFTARLDPADAYLIPKAHRLRAEAQDRVGSQLHDTALVRVSRASYDTARSMAKSSRPESDAAMALELVWIDYRYALALQVHKATTTKSLQNELLRELVAHNREHFSFNAYLRRLGNDKTAPQSSFREKKDVMALAQVSPEFAQMLRTLGWVI